MKGTRSDIKAMFADLKGLSPAKFSRLIDALWRDYLQLYAENKLAYPDLHLIDDTDPDYDDRYLYVRNNFTNGEGELVNSWSTAQGYGHSILADFAQVYGFFNYAVSQFETVMGPYAEPVNQAIDPQQPKTWRNTDRLFTLGNGENESTRSNALVIFKSGLVKWHNAQIFGAYSHQNNGETPPPLVPGILQYTALDGWQATGEDLAWHKLAYITDIPTPVYNQAPTGVINGTNQTYTLPNTPITGTLRVYLNRLRFIPGTDYTINEATITFTTAPFTGEIIMCDYEYLTPQA